MVLHCYIVCGILFVSVCIVKPLLHYNCLSSIHHILVLQAKERKKGLIDKVENNIMIKERESSLTIWYWEREREYDKTEGETIHVTDNIHFTLSNRQNSTRERMWKS